MSETVYTSSVLGGNMSKAAVFTMKLESDLRDDFVAEAAAAHRPASQVVRELMRDFVVQQRSRREHAEFLQRKVDAARGSAREGRVRSDDAVEATFAALRARTSDPA